MALPDRYNRVRETLSSTEVSYGCGGIKLFSAAEVEDGQIGYETACGDPLFTDIDAATLPVFTAIHGQGAWEIVSTSFGTPLPKTEVGADVIRQIQTLLLCDFLPWSCLLFSGSTGLHDEIEGDRRR